MGVTRCEWTLPVIRRREFVQRPETTSELERDPKISPGPLAPTLRFAGLVLEGFFQNLELAGEFGDRSIQVGDFPGFRAKLTLQPFDLMFEPLLRRGVDRWSRCRRSSVTGVHPPAAFFFGGPGNGQQAAQGVNGSEGFAVVVRTDVG